MQQVFGSISSLSLASLDLPCVEFSPSSGTAVICFAENVLLSMVLLSSSLLTDDSVVKMERFAKENSCTGGGCPLPRGHAA